MSYIALKGNKQFDNAEDWYEHNRKLGLVAGVVELDAQLAQVLLAHNTENRPVRPSRVRNYRADMLEHHWSLNGQPLIVSNDGVLSDGQHRCLAVADTEVAVPTLIVFGVEPETRVTVDQNVTRNAGDYLQMRNRPNARTAAAIVRLRLAYEANEGTAIRDTARITNAEVLEYEAEHADAVARSAAFVTDMYEQSRRYVSGAVLGLCHYLLSDVDQTAADHYIEQVAKGEGLAEGDPAYAVRARLLALGKTGAAVKIEVILLGWNALRTGRQIKSLRLSGRLPVLVR